MRPDRRALWQVNGAVLLFGFAGLFARWIGLSAIGVAFGRVVFSSLALLALQLARKKPLMPSDRNDALLLILSGAILALHWWAFMQSIQLSTVAIGTITFAAFPLFVILTEPALSHTKPKAQQVLAALLILLGVVITVPPGDLSGTYTAGILTGLLSAAAYALLTLINRRLTSRCESTQISLWEQGSAAAVLLLPTLLCGEAPTPRDIGLLAVLGVFMTALAHTLFISSLRELPAAVAGICSSMETVWSILLALFLLGEIPSVREIAGAVIILGVVIWQQVREATTLSHEKGTAEG